MCFLAMDFMGQLKNVLKESRVLANNLANVTKKINLTFFFFFLPRNVGLKRCTMFLYLNNLHTIQYLKCHIFRIQRPPKIYSLHLDAAFSV